MNSNLMTTATSATGRRQARRARSRGSVLMVALILSGAIALALTSYLQLASATAKLSNRSYYMDGAQNLGDLGLEHALWSMNNQLWTTGNQYQVTLPPTSESSSTSAGGYYLFSGNVKGQVKIWADLTDAYKPHVVVKSVVTLNDGSQVTKYAEAYLKTRSVFDNGIVGNTLDLNGVVDGWNSDPTHNGSYLPYSTTLADANGKIAALSTTVGAADTGQTDINGYAAVGSSEGGGGITVGSQGVIGDASYVATHRNSIQDGHATYDFTASFPDATFPTVPTVSATGGAYSAGTFTGGNVTLPGATDVAASDGTYYYQVSSISLSGNSDTIQVTGGKKVVLMVTGDVSVGGSCPGIVIGSSGSLKLYTPGTVSISGNGVTNGTASQTSGTLDYNHIGQPIDFQLYGTRTAAYALAHGSQSISIGGNGYLSAAVYAPNSAVHVNGNGAIFGAVVGGTVQFSGTNARFHFDESLQDDLSNGTWKLRKWRELSTASEMALYDSQLTF
jgi:hypothetical protein